MIVTFVLRLVSTSLAREEVVGQIEAVGTGEQGTVRGVDDLVAFASRAAANAATEGES